MRELNIHDAGVDVTYAQERLAALGFCEGAPTGSFDDETRRAVRALQASAGLPRTGVIDGRTWDALLDTQNARFVQDDMADQVGARAFFNEPEHLDLPAPAHGEADSTFEPVGAGEGGPALEDVVARLRALGFDVPAETTLGPGTAAALKAWQEARFLEPTGVVDEPTWTALRVETAGLAPMAFALESELIDPSLEPLAFGLASRDVDGTGGYRYRQYEDGGVQILRSPTGPGDGRILRSGAAWRAITAEIGAFPVSTSSGLSSVAAGGSGAAVKSAQRRLNELGFGPLDEDGVLGPASAAALRRFQAATGITATGALDAVTAARLAHPWDDLAQGAFGAEVSWAQGRLAALGFSPGKVDGDYGGKTAEAVRRFQASKGLPVTGIIDERTGGHLHAATTAAPPADLLHAERERLAGVVTDATASLPSTERDRVHKVLLEAVRWYGLVEIPKGSNAGAEIGAITEGTYAPGTAAPPWCALAICTWVLRGLGLSKWEELPWGWRNAHSLSFGRWGEKKGLLLPPTATAPAGSIFVMYREGSGSDAGSAHSAGQSKWDGLGHTGLVLADQGDQVLTLDGNVSDKVWSGTRRKSSLLGYITWWR